MASFITYTSTSYSLELSPPDYFDSESTPSKTCLPPSCSKCNQLLKTEREKEEHEKGQDNLQWRCCQRFVCGPCVMKNPHLKSYCPFCHTPTTTGPDTHTPSSKLPPSYDSTLRFHSHIIPPPSYNLGLAQSLPGIHHFVRPTDSLPSLSLAYHTPLSTLRRLNNLYTDSLLHAHRSIFIPKTHYDGPSLSPVPPGGEREEEKRVLVKRFQCLTKTPEVRVAEWYLNKYGWDLEEAVEKWGEDAQWERELGGLRPGFGGLTSSASLLGVGRGRSRRGWGLFRGF